MKWAAIFFALIAVASAGWYIMQPDYSQTGTQTDEGVALPAGALVTVTLPASFTEQEQIGAGAYDAVCAVCHGLNGQGRDGVAPPLVHKIYEPSHHSDMAFVLAATLLRNSGGGHASPFPGHTYPTASVTGMPSAVKPFSTATRI